MIFPLVAVGLGIICSLIGLFVVRKSGVKEPSQAGGRDPGDIAMGQLNKGYYVTAVLAILGIFGAAYFLLGPTGPHWWVFAVAGLVGIAQQHRLRLHHPVLHLRHVSPGARDRRGRKTGPATTIISGLAVGFENTALPVLAICGPLGLAYYLGTLARLLAAIGSIGGIYGTAVATMGMLMSAATSWRWTPSARSPTTPAASSR